MEIRKIAKTEPSVTVDPERHDDDHPELGGRTPDKGAVGTPGPKSDHGDRKREPVKVVDLLASIFGGVKQVIEPKPRDPTLPSDEEEWRTAVESSVIAVGTLVDRLIAHLPQRVEVAPSDVITTGQVNLSSGVSVQIVGRQPDRLRLQLTHRQGGAASVYVGTQGVTDGSGREVAAGETVTLNTKAAVYAYADDADSRLDWLIEVGER